MKFVRNRWLLIAGLGALMLLSVGAYVYLVSEDFGARLFSVLALRLQDEFGVRATAGRFKLSASYPNVIVEDLQLSKEGEFSARIDTIKIAVESAQLGIPNDLESVSISGVEIVLVLPESKAESKGSSAFTGIDIDFGNLPYNLKIKRINLNHVSVKIIDSNGTPRAEVHDLRIAAFMQRNGSYALSVTSPVIDVYEHEGVLESDAKVENVSVSAALRDRGVFVSELGFDFGGHEHRASLRWRDMRKPYMEWKANGSLDLHIFHELFDVGKTRFAGVVSYSLKQRGNPTRAALEGVIDLNSVRITDYANDVYKIDSAHLPFRFKNDLLDISEAYLVSGKEGRVLIHEAAIETVNKWRCSIAGEFDGVELAEVLDALTITGSFVMLKVDGKYMLEGTLKPLLLKGDAQLNVSRFRLFSHAFDAPREKDDLIMSIPSAAVKSHITIDENRVRLTRGSVMRNGSVIYVVRNDFNFDGTYYLEYRSDKLQLADAGSIAGISYSGIAKLHTVIAGPYESATIRSSATVDDLVIDGRFDVGRATFVQFFKPYVLSFGQIETSDGKRGKLQANLKFDFTTDLVKVYADFYSEGYRVKRILRALRIKDVDIDGRFFGAGEVSGVLPHVGGSVSGNVVDANIYGVKVPTVKIDAVADKRGNLTINGLDGIFKSGRLKVSGSISSKGDLDFSIVSQNLKAAEIPLIHDMNESLDADLLMTAELNGKVSHPVLDGDIAVRNMVLDGHSVEPSDVHVSLDGTKLHVAGDLLGNQIAASMDAELKKGNFKLHSDIKRIDVANLMRQLYGKATAEGVLDASIDLWGNLNRPNKTNGTLLLREFGITSEGIGVNLYAKRSLKIENSRLIIKDVKIDGDIDGELVGFVDKDLRFELSINGKSKLGVLSKIGAGSSGIQADGDVRFKVSLSGSPKTHPALDGVAYVRNGMFLVSKEIPAFENVEATVVFSGTSIFLERIKAIVGGGALQGSGTIELNDDLSLKSMSIPLSLHKGMYVISREMKPVIDANLTISGNKAPFLLSGDVRIISLRYTKNIPWEMRVFENLSKIFEPKRTAELITDDRNPIFKFDINITGKDNIQLYNNLAQIDFTADLRLSGTELSPGLLGTLSAYKGIIIFQAKNFIVKSFVVRFIEPDRIVPSFNILAETEPIDYTCGANEGTTVITIHITGEADDYKIEYSADAPDLIDATQIWSVLMAGDCGKEDETLESSMKNLVGGILTTPFEKYFGVESRVVFEPIQTSAGTTKVVPRFTIGKRLTPHMTVIYSSTFAEEEGDDRRLQIRYRKKNFSLSGEWSSGNVHKQGGIGLEFIYHFEF